MSAVEHRPREVSVEGVDVPLNKVSRVVGHAARKVLHSEGQEKDDNLKVKFKPCKNKKKDDGREGSILT